MAAKTLTLTGSTIGRKAVMAASGIVLLGFVLVHMSGNLLVFAGREKLNAYADLLRAFPAALWGARFVLLGAVAAHAWAGISLTKLNRRARPVAYQRKQDLATTYAAKMMPVGGVVLLLFILFHLAHLTFGVAIPGGKAPAPLMGAGVVSGTDVYANVVNSFNNPIIAIIYVVAQLALALHLYHGAWSLFQTLGASHPRYDHLRQKFAVAFAAVVCLGNIAIPTAILAGIIR